MSSVPLAPILKFYVHPSFNKPVYGSLIIFSETVADTGFLWGGFYPNNACEAHAKIFAATPTFHWNHANFQAFSIEASCPTCQSIHFRSRSLLRHAEVSHRGRLLKERRDHWTRPLSNLEYSNLLPCHEFIIIWQYWASNALAAVNRSIFIGDPSSSLLHDTIGHLYRTFRAGNLVAFTKL